MVNDTSTVAGALQECIDHLEDNLAAKGVTASYAPSTGMIGLIDEILNIQTGGSCYHIEFSESSYTAVGGSATLEVYLQSNYQPLSGATVTVTGSDSSLYTGITNSNGVANVTVENVSGTVNFTCSYQNVSATCVVNGSSYLFRDGGVTGDVNTDYFNLGGTINVNVSSTGTNISCSSYQDSARCPNVLLTGDFEITYDLIARTGEGGGWFIILPNNISGTSFTYTAYIDSNSNQGWNINYNGDSWINQGKTIPCSVKITREDSTFSIYIDGSLVNQKNVISSDIYIGWKTHSASGRNFTFKDLIIKAL